MSSKPNKVTEEALHEAEEGNLKSFDSVEELFKDLDKDDEDE